MKKFTSFLALILFTTMVFGQIPNGFSYQALLRDVNGNLITNKKVGIQISILQGSETGTVVYSETQTPTTNSNGLIAIKIGELNTIDWSSGPYFIKTETDPAGGTNYTITGINQLLSVPYAQYAKTAGNITITGNEMVFEGWDKDSSDDFDGKYTSLTDAPSNISYFTNDAGYLTSKTEIDPVFNASVAKGITSADTAAWNSKHTVNESDPVFNASIAKGITSADTAAWNAMSSFDGRYSSLTERPNLNIYARKDMHNQNITNLADPISEQDAATKAYVDALQAKITAMEEMLIETNLFTLIDIDGNKYKVIKIGSQVWMAENLKTTKYNDGTEIPQITNNTQWYNSETPDYCWYNNNQDKYSNDYGALYNWYTVETDKLCPAGWHVPSSSEWKTMESYLGGTAIAGGKLKETGTSHWSNPNVGATNEIAFTALPGGYRNSDFSKLQNYGFWWTATQIDSSDPETIPSTKAVARYLHYNNAKLNYSSYPKNLGFSVRCVKD